ncbi:hypothetical protein BIW11_06620 [Tropilaelaps mercedesae]|uniref:Uncharacterized protein n=1 Tax=Tropilaelaps mercedesae TaxID=418985 RepID=A0A1V9XXB8_9ACAR|nr:hypothetical protein BIW11_06620 [Tropilaelaps mercedesae]
MKYLLPLVALALHTQASQDSASMGVAVHGPKSPHSDQHPLTPQATVTSFSSRSFQKDHEVTPATSDQVISLPHENSVGGRPIPREHHHSVHWRPEPGPDYEPYQPVAQYHYTPTREPQKIYKPLPTASTTTAKPRYPYDKWAYYGQELNSEGCGCIPYRYS